MKGGLLSVSLVLFIYRTGVRFLPPERKTPSRRDGVGPSATSPFPLFSLRSALPYICFVCPYHCVIVNAPLPLALELRASPPNATVNEALLPFVSLSESTITLIAIVLRLGARWIRACMGALPQIYPGLCILVVGCANRVGTRAYVEPRWRARRRCAQSCSKGSHHSWFVGA